jgi:hypothetical protein
MKKNLDYLLDDPSLCQVWVELKLTKTNPLHDDYFRLDSVEVTLDEASKIAHARCKGIVVEYQGKEYTNTWDGKLMPRLAVGTARLWCSKAWELSNQKRQLEKSKIDKRDAKLKAVLKYLHIAGRESIGREEILSLPRDLQAVMVDTIYDRAKDYLSKKGIYVA